MGHFIEGSSIVVDLDRGFLKRVQKTSLIVGIALALVGLAGVIMPQIMSLVSGMFLGSLLIMAGLLAAYLVFLGKGRSVVAWLKPVLLIITGALFLFYPVAGIATMALLLTFYLLLDAFVSFALAYDFRELQGWLWMVFNGILSLLLAALVLNGWPENSALWVGIYIGISLLFDGLALIFVSHTAGKMIKS